MATTRFSLNITAPDGLDPISSSPRKTAIDLEKLFRQLAGGHKTVSYTVACRESAVAASGTVTCAAVQAADTVTIAGVTFTAANGSPVGNQFDMSLASDTLVAADLVRSINASATAGISGCVTATNVLGVVTITASMPGKLGNAITLASSNGTRLAVSGARLASGAETLTTHSF
jgi:phage tail sheath gpL-like